MRKLIAAAAMVGALGGGFELGKTLAEKDSELQSSMAASSTAPEILSIEEMTRKMCGKPRSDLDYKMCEMEAISADQNRMIQTFDDALKDVEKTSLEVSEQLIQWGQGVDTTNKRR